MNRKFLWLHILALVIYFLVAVILVCCVFGFSFPSDDLLQVFMEGVAWAVLAACMALVIRAAFRKLDYLLALWKDARAVRRGKVQYK